MKLFVWGWSDCTNSVHLWLLLFFTTSSISANILFSHEHNAFNNNTGEPSAFSPARRSPQGFDAFSTESLESSASYRNVLQFPIRNFTKVATIRYTKNNNDEASSEGNKNTYSSIINSKPYKNPNKPALVLTLSLKPPFGAYNINSSTEEPHPLELIEQATTALVTQEIKHSINETLGNNKSPEIKPFNILDRLRNLSKQRLQQARNRSTAGPGLNFGIQSFGQNSQEKTEGDKSSSQIKHPGPNVNVKVTTISTKITNTPSDYASSDDEPTTISHSKFANGPAYDFIASSSPSPSKIPRLPPISSIISPIPSLTYSTTPVVLKIGKLSLEQNEGSYQSNSVNKSADEGINTGETRAAITADQLSGNRPTSRPFHFTTPPPTPPPPSTTIPETSRINRYQRPHSPHNHIFAPTRDPVSDVDNDEDLSVEEFQDIRVANAVFGSKVGTDVSTPDPIPNKVQQVTANIKSTRNKVSGKAFFPVVPPSTTSTSPPIVLIHNNKHRHQLLDEEDDDDEEDEYLNPLQKNFKNRPSVKIVTPAPTPPPTTRPPQIIPQRKFTPTKNNFVKSKSNQKDTSPIPSPSPAAVPSPHSASSGVKNSHAAVNDNLPFYKEPGGIFKEHSNSNKYHDSSLDDNDLDIDQDPEDDLNPNLNLNQVAHNSNKSPKVKHAPNGRQSHFHQQQNIPQAVYPTNNPNQFQYVQQQPVGFIQPHAPQNIYFQPVGPTPFYPHHQGQLYPTQAAPAFVPIQQIQGYHQQPLAAPPIYSHQQQHQHQPAQKSSRAQNRQHNYDTPPIAPKPINRDNFPEPDDPESDDFYGDPRPDTSKANNKKNSRTSQSNRVPPPTPPSKNRNQQQHRQQQHKNYNNNENNKRRGEFPPESNRRRGPDYDTEDDDENNRRYEDKPKPRPPPPQRNQIQHRNSKPNQNDRNDDYDYTDDEGDDEEGRNDNKKHRHRDYDGDFNNQRPVYDQPSSRPNQDVRNRNNGPFRPSPIDQAQLRPSSQDFNSPNFDHPNIQYPNRGSGIQHNNYNNQPLFNRGPEYDPRGFGVGYGPAPRSNVQLDPIYTRTIKQFDEENKRAPQQQTSPPPQRFRNNNNRHNHRDDEKSQQHDDDDVDNDRSHDRDDDNEGRRERKRGQQRPPSKEDEKEEEEEEEDDEPPPPRKITKVEEEEEEDEEPEEERRPRPANENEDDEESPPPKPKPKPGAEKEEEQEEEQEEEEEEEEEEEPEGKRKPLGNRQRKGGDGQQGKKVETSKKPPPNEKSGDLDQDIKEIEQEFGGILG